MGMRLLVSGYPIPSIQPSQSSFINVMEKLLTHHPSRARLISCAVCQCYCGSQRNVAVTLKWTPRVCLGKCMGANIRTVNLEDGMPTLAQARARLTSELQSARQSGVAILKLIHGYGSTGVGGELRVALQATLRQMAERREIRDCIYGENWRKSDERAWELVKQLPKLKDDRDFGRNNKGITIVWL
jgi:hypothetical protein